MTGAARGLGRGLAVGLARAGADVAVLDVLEAPETVAEVQALGGRAVALRADLAELGAEGARAVVAEAAEALGGLDVLVNNAGVISRAPAERFPEADWRRTLAIDLDAVWHLCQAAGARWLDAGERGRIVNVASLLSFQGGILVPAYAAAKHAVAGVTKALANEWAGRGIGVNAIAPGYFATEVTAGIREDPERTRAMLARIPAGRWGEPADLEGAVVFLASEASAYVHGVVLPVDGGWLAR